MRQKQLICAGEENRIDDGRKNIIKSVGAGSNAKAANREKRGEINACNCSKNKLGPVKWVSVV